MARTVPLMDLDAFKARYPEWLETNRDLLNAADWKGAFKDYPFAVNGEAPWGPLGKPVSRCRVGVLTTAGLYVKDRQPPFDAPNIEGDWSFRELPGGVWGDDLGIAHDHYPHDAALQDLNAVYPLERLAELAAGGIIGGLTDSHLSISGYCTRLDLLVEQTVPQILTALERIQPEIVLHIPV